MFYPHEAGIPVVVVQNTGPFAAPLFRKNNHGWQLREVVAKRQHDHHLEKILPIAFGGADPDGIRLEVTNYRQERRDRHDHWDELPG